MRGFRNVLVPLDFSPSSAGVVEAATRVLDPQGRLLLLHVVEWLPTVSPGAIGVYAHSKDMAALHRDSEAKLRDEAARHPGVRIDVEAIEGTPAGAILEVAERERPDLIVIGSKSRKGLEHLLIGSVAERVLRKATCPVLVYRD
jgi:nucleotide-binding universal stress UspA family protein